LKHLRDDDLVLYQDGEIRTAPAERHLHVCRGCRERLQALDLELTRLSFQSAASPSPNLARPATSNSAMSQAVETLPALDLTFRSGYRLSKPMGGIDVRPAEGSDSDSFRALVEEHSPMVFRLAFRMTGNVPDAEDVVQETFLKAHRSLGGFDERARFGTWIYRIAVNASIDLIRRRGRLTATGRTNEDAPPVVETVASTDPLPDRLAMSGQIERSVAAAMSQLSERERAAFVLRHMEGMPIERIGEILKIGPNAVKQTVFRAVQKLRRELAPLAGVA
jgi:RNA polymerase sigma-70 factor, ECF subfamily